MNKITPKKPSTPVKTTAKGKQRAWDVILDGEVIDTVFYDSDMGESEVKRSLVNHDGYDSSIKLKSRKAAVAKVKTPQLKRRPVAAVKKKASPDGMMYFDITIQDDFIESDKDSDDENEKERFEEFLQLGNGDMVQAMLTVESKFVAELTKKFTSAIGSSVKISNEGHGNFGNLVCKFYVTEADLPKAFDAIERMAYNTEGTVASDYPYAEAQGWEFFGDGNKRITLEQYQDGALEENKTASVKKRKRVALTEAKTAASKRTALHAKSTPAIEEQMDKVEALLNKVEAAKDDTYIWRKWRTLRKEYKLALIPQIKEYLEKNFGVNAQDNNLPIIRNLDKLEIALENTDVGTESLAQDKERAAKGKQVIAFLDRLARVQGAPLAGIVELLNSLDLRKEANTVAEFIKNSKSISDTVQRVVVG